MIDWIDVNEALPPKREGWPHSEQVLIHYEGFGYDTGEYIPAWYFPEATEYNAVGWYDKVSLYRYPTHWAALNKPGATK